MRKSSDGGLTWATVDLFRYTPGLNSSAMAFAADSSGNIYVAGYGGGPGSRSFPENLHWLVRKSSDGGQTWTLVDDLYSAAKGGFPKWGMPIRADYVPGVGLFVAGRTSGSENGVPQIWTVRKSIDAGVTWLTMDSYQMAQGYNADANGISHDNQGNIYVAGSAVVPQVTKHTTTTSTEWVVRKSSDGGKTWATADFVSPATSQIAGASSIGRDAAGNLVVVGRYEDAQSVFHWLVRRQDSLGHWQTVDDFRLGLSSYAEARDVIVDAAGNLVVTGEADDASPGSGGHWIVRRLANSVP